MLGPLFSEAPISGGIVATCVTSLSRCFSLRAFLVMLKPGPQEPGAPDFGRKRYIILNRLIVQYSIVYYGIS